MVGRLKTWSWSQTAWFFAYNRSVFLRRWNQCAILLTFQPVLMLVDITKYLVMSQQINLREVAMVFARLYIEQSGWTEIWPRYQINPVHVSQHGSTCLNNSFEFHQNQDSEFKGFFILLLRFAFLKYILFLLYDTQNLSSKLKKTFLLIYFPFITNN